MHLRLPLLPLRAAAAVLGLAATLGAQADALDVAAGRAALARGAVAWDLRASGPALPGAVRVAPQALQAFLARGDVDALAAAVSAAGLNLGGEVLVYADDPAQAFDVAERVQPLARGRVHWLRATPADWRAAGGETVATVAPRLPMPQRLLDERAAGDARPAAAARRSTATLAFLTEGPTQIASR